MTTTGPALTPTVPDPRARHASLTGSAGPRHLWTRWAALALVLVGVLARVRQWAGGRSLWLDEALVARSLVERGHAELATEPLLHNQAAPQAWLHASRLAVTAFGDGERALRLVSLLAGCAALVLLWRLAARLLPPVLVPVAVGLAALSPELVYYSNEVKPYALDVAVVLAVLLVALRGRPVPLALTGAVTVWVAYPSVFVLAAASLVLVLRDARPVRTALLLSPWLVSLAAAYVLVLAPLRGREVFEQFWAYAYPTGTADLPAWLLERLVDLAEDPLRLTLPALAALLLVLGAARLLVRDPRAAALLLLPVAFAVLAGAISAYPLADRLALWLVPVVAVLLAASLHRGDGRRPLVAGLALLVVAGPAVLQALPLLVRTQQVQELRPVLEQLAEQRRPGDLVLVDIAAKGAFDFYAPRTGVPRDGVVLFRTPDDASGDLQRDCGDDLVALRTGRFGNGRVWLVFSHELTEGAVLGSRADLLGRIGRVTRLADRLSAPGAEALLLSPARGGRDLPPAPLTEDRCLVVNRSAR